MRLGRALAEPADSLSDAATRGRLALGLALFAVLAQLPMSGLALVSTTGVDAAIIPPQYAASVGFDISWPNCRAAYPASARFGLVGVNGGRPYTVNPCLAHEYAVASRLGKVRLYINIDTSIRSTARHGLNGPAGSACSPTKSRCWAYNFGYNAAKFAWLTAYRTLGAAAVRTSWWLDVEVGGWSTNRWTNVRAIQGALDFLGRRGYYGAPARGYTVGVYSTTLQWREITGTSYRPGVPVWYATVEHSVAAASAHCSTAYAFTGGRVWMVQWVGGRIDADYRCPAA